MIEKIFTFIGIAGPIVGFIYVFLNFKKLSGSAIDRDWAKKTSNRRQAFGDSIDALSAMSSQMNTASANLSDRAELQASSLRNTVSSIEQLSTRELRNAKHAQEANHLASSVSHKAKESEAAVGHALEAMNAVTNSARSVTELISVIDDIANQANILALNAAVEAARAGKEGRGLTEVATAVRELSIRSNNAAKELAILIGNSTAQVEQGNRLMETAAANLGDVVASTQMVSDLISDISTASLEQSDSISSVNQAITQIGSVAQQNTALIRDASATSQSIKAQAEELAKVVKSYP